MLSDEARRILRIAMADDAKADEISDLIDLLDGLHPASSADEAIIRFDGNTGKQQATGVLIDDNDNMSAVQNLAADGQMYSDQHDISGVGTDEDLDWNNGNKQNLDLADYSGNLTLSDPLNPRGGAEYRLYIKQGPTARTITWPAKFKFPGGTAPTLSIGDNDVDLIYLDYDDEDDVYYARFDQDFS